MKTLFIVERNLYYKYYAKIIDYLLACNCEVHLAHTRNPTQLSGENLKSFYYPFISQIPSFSGGKAHVFSYNLDIELGEYVRSNNIKNIFSLSSRASFKFDSQELTWHCLQHGIDSFKEKNFDADHFYIYTKAWTEGSGFNLPPKSKLHETGLYYLSQPDNRDIILKKYGLPTGKKFFFFAPLPFDKGHQYIFVKGKLTRRFMNTRLLKLEDQLLKDMSLALKAFGAELIIKSRFKRFLPASYSQYGHVFYDESFYPSSLVELASISEAILCNFMPSALCTEAIYLKKPYFVLNYPEYDKYLEPHMNNYIKNLFEPAGDGADTLPAKNLSWLNDLAQGRLQPKNYNEYERKFIGSFTSEESLKLIYSNLSN